MHGVDQNQNATVCTHDENVFPQNFTHRSQRAIDDASVSSTFWVSLTRIPTWNTIMPPPALGSLGTPSASSRAQSAGNSLLTRCSLISLAPLLVTARKVKHFFVRPSKAMPCATAFVMFFENIRPAKKFSNCLRLGWCFRIRFKKHSMSALHRAWACSCNSMWSSQPLLTCCCSATCKVDCPKTGWSCWKSPTKATNGPGDNSANAVLIFSHTVGSCWLISSNMIRS